jgi:hypothetical protein
MYILIPEKGVFEWLDEWMDGCKLVLRIALITAIKNR